MSDYVADFKFFIEYPNLIDYSKFFKNPIVICIIIFILALIGVGIYFIFIHKKTKPNSGGGGSGGGSGSGENCSTPCQNGGTCGSDNKCTCVGNWDSSTSCSTCVGNWDPSTKCATCVGNWDPSTNCSKCIGNWDPSTNCSKCVGNWDPSTNCSKCVGNFDPSTSCSKCVGNFDPSTSCSKCVGNWDPSTKCATCVNDIQVINNKNYCTNGIVQDFNCWLISSKSLNSLAANQTIYITNMRQSTDRGSSYSIFNFDLVKLTTDKIKTIILAPISDNTGGNINYINSICLYDNSGNTPPLTITFSNGIANNVINFSEIKNIDYTLGVNGQSLDQDYKIHMYFSSDQ